MTENRASKRKTAVILTLTALAMLFAWIHSCFPASLSSRESGGIFWVVYRFFSLFGMQAAVTEQLIRKLAHFSEFAVIGGLLLGCARCFDRRRPLRFYPCVLLAGLLAAMTDETIQLFVEGRAGMIADVWIDFGGVLFGSLLTAGAFACRKRKNRNGGYDGTGNGSGK